MGLWEHEGSGGWALGVKYFGSKHLWEYDTLRSCEFGKMWQLWEHGVLYRGTLGANYFWTIGRWISKLWEYGTFSQWKFGIVGHLEYWTLGV